MMTTFLHILTTFKHLMYDSVRAECRLYRTAKEKNQKLQTEHSYKLLLSAKPTIFNQNLLVQLLGPELPVHLSLLSPKQWDNSNWKSLPSSELLEEVHSNRALPNWPVSSGNEE